MKGSNNKEKACKAAVYAEVSQFPQFFFFFSIVQEKVIVKDFIFRTMQCIIYFYVNVF